MTGEFSDGRPLSCCYGFHHNAPEVTVPHLWLFPRHRCGSRTRPPSRFLLIAPPLEGLDRPGTVSLDFNRAYLPPCAFTDEFNCPLPPSHHRFDVDVPAGETWAEFSDAAPPGAAARVEFP